MTTISTGKRRMERTIINGHEFALDERSGT
jgi:hypothetical protein